VRQGARGVRRAAAAAAVALAIPVAVALAAPPLSAQSWSFHAGVGSAWNVPLPLAIEQAGQPRISLTAHWETRPFATPLYYVGRIERRVSHGALGLELIHHKV